MSFKLRENEEAIQKKTLSSANTFKEEKAPEGEKKDSTETKEPLKEEELFVEAERV